MKYLEALKDYLQSRQPPMIRSLHLAVLLMVIAQLVLSNFVEIDDNGQLEAGLFSFYGSWAHFLTGLSLLAVFGVFMAVELKTHGFYYFFPYLQKDFEQIKKDIDQLKKLSLPEPEPKGLAAVVQGLGMGAMVWTLLAGALWFTSWQTGFPGADAFKELHEGGTSLVIAYLLGHGSMGLLHVYLSNIANNPKGKA